MSKPLARAALLLAALMFLSPMVAAQQAASAPASSPAAAGYPVGLRIFQWRYQAEDGSSLPLAAAVWYPAAKDAGPSRSAYPVGLSGRAIRDAAPARQGGPFPLIVFSHGYGGGALQSIFLTEQLAARGYVVAACDHNDPVALLRVTGRTSADPLQLLAEVGDLIRSRDQFPFDQYAYRPKELSLTIDRLLELNADTDSPLSGLVDPRRIGCAGHSMGGYTCLAVSGCWPQRTDKRISAAVMLSPAVFMWAQDDYRRLKVPAMYMVGQYELTSRRDKPFDIGWAYEKSPAPKWLLVVRQGHHLTFANALPFRRPTASLPVQPVAGQQQAVCKYTLALFDRYLKQDAAAEKVLRASDDWLTRMESDLGQPASAPQR